ncbi:MAG TPA: hypothetical protein DD624_02580 [Alphaproteobacteria bacterium]|nr:hypothetical protein [Alphaproteobacteria bacterium]
MKDLFEAIVTFLIVGAFAVAGIVLTAFGSVIAGAFYLVGIIAAVILAVISVIALMIAVLFSPKKNLDAGGRKR